MTHPKPPRKPKLKPSLPLLDPALSEKESTMLRVPACTVADVYDAAIGCADKDCFRCRVGRAAAWASKTAQDAAACVTVFEDVLDDLDEAMAEGRPERNVNLALAYVAIKEVGTALDELEYWVKTYGMAVGLSPTENGVGIRQVEITDRDDGQVQADFVVRLPGEPDEDRVN